MVNAASPAYLARFGVPRSLDDLQRQLHPHPPALCDVFAAGVRSRAGCRRKLFQKTGTDVNAKRPWALCIAHNLPCQRSSRRQRLRHLGLSMQTSGSSQCSDGELSETPADTRQPHRIKVTLVADGLFYSGACALPGSANATTKIPAEAGQKAIGHDGIQEILKELCATFREQWPQAWI